MQKLPLLFVHDRPQNMDTPLNRPLPFTFMPEEVLTDAVNTFWMRTQGHLSLIGNLLVIKEEEEVCVCSCSIIHLQKTKDPTRLLRKSKLW